MEPFAPFSEAGFAAATLNRAAPPPPGIAGGDRGGRFAVHRNNVLGGLVRALEARFAVVRRLVGEEFFAAMATAFAAAHPPRSPVMMAYGAAFPGFIAAFPQAASLPYLADVAALEAARGRAYHAADASGVPAEAFARLSAQDLAALRVALHPSVELLRSTHPVVSIWSAHRGDDAPVPIDAWHGEDALVYRAGEAVATVALPPGEAAFIETLLVLAPLGEAAAMAMAASPAFDPAPALARLIGSGLVVALSQRMETDT
jgi:hypothetical protein